MQTAFAEALSGFHMEGTNSDDMFASFVSQLRSAASVAGLEPRVCSSAWASRAPFLDSECRRLKNLVRLARERRAEPAEIKALERQYHSYVCTRKRQHTKQRLHSLLQEKHTAPRKFWKKLRGSAVSLPPQLQSTAVWDNYIQSLADPPLPQSCFLPDLAFPQLPYAPATVLNNAISSSEVSKDIKLLNNGRASGTLGLPSELLRYGIMPASEDCPFPVHQLVGPLTALLNPFFISGTVPSTLNHALITPVFKEGDKCDTTNYRPIAVTEPISRLYASILNDRLIQFTEDNGLRAPSQAGFRPKLSTLHCLFTLQHFINKSIHFKKPLYCCFLDLKAAYDRIQRPLLWEALSRLGLHGEMLQALQGLYTNATVSVRVQGHYGSKADSKAGQTRMPFQSDPFWSILGWT